MRATLYGVLQDVFEFVSTFKDFPPRSHPASFNPANVMEDTLGEIKAGRKIKEMFPQLQTPEPPKK